MTQTVSTALTRKLTAGQEDQGDKPRSVLRALRLAFARAAGDRLQLPLAVIGAKQSLRMPEVLSDRVADDWLLLQFVDGEGGSAAICMDLGTVSAIVQVQTIGEVLPDTPAARRFTHTDGAMVAPLVEDALMRAVALVDTPVDQSSLSGYEFAGQFADLRTMSLAMVENVYRVFELTVELGGGLRQGQISVLLPDRTSEEDHEITLGNAGPNLEQASGVLRAELNTVICRMSLPLASLTGLGVGDVLPLAEARLDRAEILTIDRTRAAIGRLGQCGGMRAVRLNEYAPLSALTQTISEDFLEARSQGVRAARAEMSTPTIIPTVSDAYDPNAPDDIEVDLNFTRFRSDGCRDFATCRTIANRSRSGWSWLDQSVLSRI